MRPFRRMSLQFAQRGFIDAFTFILLQSFRPKSLEPSGDAPFASIRIKLHHHAVPNEDADAVEPHLACKVRKYLFSRFERNTEHRVRQGFIYDTLHLITFGIHSVRSPSYPMPKNLSNKGLLRSGDHDFYFIGIAREAALPEWADGG